MTDAVRWNGQMPGTRPQQQQSSPPANGGGGGGDNLADILERVLDKGIVIAGDIKINLLDIELLTIKIRLVVASVDRAKEMGIDWWERDPTLSSGYSELEEENRRLRDRLARLEERREPEAIEDEPIDAELEEGDDPEGLDVDDEPVEDPVEDDPPEAEPEPEPAPAPRRRRARS